MKKIKILLLQIQFHQICGPELDNLINNTSYIWDIPTFAGSFD